MAALRDINVTRLRQFQSFFRQRKNLIHIATVYVLVALVFAVFSIFKPHSHFLSGGILGTKLWGDVPVEDTNSWTVTEIIWRHKKGGNPADDAVFQFSFSPNGILTSFEPIKVLWPGSGYRRNEDIVFSRDKGNWTFEDATRGSLKKEDLPSEFNFKVRSVIQPEIIPDPVRKVRVKIGFILFAVALIMQSIFAVGGSILKEDNPYSIHHLTLTDAQAQQTSKPLLYAIGCLPLGLSCIGFWLLSTEIPKIRKKAVPEQTSLTICVSALVFMSIFSIPSTAQKAFVHGVHNVTQRV